MGDETQKSVLGTAAEVVATELGTALGGAAGGVIIRIVSHLGKKFLVYWQTTDVAAQNQSINQLQLQRENQLPPFAVVGLGRCGSHVTAQLARMVVDASPQTRSSPEGEPKSFLSRIFSSKGTPGILTIEPFMVVGDIDETTFADVDGIVGKDAQGASVAGRMLRIDYRPLAHGGAGHVPVFGEFMTRGLLLLPPGIGTGNQSAWKLARSYLIDSCSRTVNPTRLVFYLFSSGGGTGGGSAPEIMRAQRFAITSSKDPDPEIYFAGVAVLPYDMFLNKKHLINTGRAFVQYLAELRINLPSEIAYYKAQDFQFGLEVEFSHGLKTVAPWDSLAVISNDIMSAPSSSPTREEAEGRANQYIAQQVFNLAAGQLPTGSYKSSGEIPITAHLNFKSIRLDPADLRTGLSGPFAVGFSMALDSDTKSADWLDKMFIRALNLPKENSANKGGVERTRVEGISIAPEGSEEEGYNCYAQKIRLIEDRLAKAGDSQNKTQSISQDDLKALAEIPLFKRCPQVVFVFTAPQNADIPQDVDRRFVQLLSWLMPNLNQARYAVIRGTTATYTLSIYMQGSVVLCPDVQNAIFNYLWLCWGKRTAEAESFSEIYKTLANQLPPLLDSVVLEIFGQTENIGAEAGNFDSQSKFYNDRWEATVKSMKLPPNREEELLKHKVSDCFVTPQELAAALRFINYMSHVSTRKPTKAPKLG